MSSCVCGSTLYSFRVVHVECVGLLRNNDRLIVVDLPLRLLMLYYGKFCTLGSRVTTLSICVIEFVLSSRFRNFFQSQSNSWRILKVEVANLLPVSQRGVTAVLIGIGLNSETQ